LIEHGKGGKRKVVDYKLSQYACYLIVQNGDRIKKSLLQDKHILPFKRAGRKLPIISTA
jgi:hypothetical protein